MGALQSHLQQNMKNAKMKERMQSKLQQKQQQQASPTTQQKPNSGSNNTTRPNNSVYVAPTGENIQQTPRAAKPPTVGAVVGAGGGATVHTPQTNENIILDTSSTSNTDNVNSNENNKTGYEPAVNAQNKKKKNKHKK